MTDGVISTVLPSILAGEPEAIRADSLKGEGVVDEVHVASGPLLVVLDKLVVEVTAGHVIC